MQQPPQMIPMMPSYPPANITTEQIQKYLDENKKLILAILDNQNLGKLAECAQYQAVLQKNLMYLAAIADAQPQTPAMPPQMAQHPAMQQGAFFMQHPQAAAMAQQAGVFPPKMPLQFGGLHQVQDPQQLHQMSGMRPVAPSNPIHSDATLGAGGPSAANNKQDAPDGQGKSGGDGAEDGK